MSPEGPGAGGEALGWGGGCYQHKENVVQDEVREEIEARS